VARRGLLRLLLAHDSYDESIDWRLYHALNVFVAGHDWIGSAAARLETWGVLLLAASTFALWFFARPGAGRKWKLACASALASSAVALVLNQLVALAWRRQRPFAAHPGAHVWGGRSHDPSFPSDHASAAFAVAFAVLEFDRRAGALFLVAAAVIGAGRVIVGAHYPGDVVAGVLVGLGAAVLVTRVARPLVAWVVRVVERLSDPLLAPVWRRVS
jgi:undecaprenyl-diphosphatase